MKSVYIETTIPSYYHEKRQAPLVVAWRDVTRRWWDHHRERYSLATSEYVVAELKLAPAEKAAKALALLSQVPRLGDPAGVRDVAEYYIEHQLIPAGAEGDAMPVALASMHRMEFLLTWNCRHLANANKIRHLGVLNARLGLHVPVITTPLTLMAEEGP